MPKNSFEIDLGLNLPKEKNKNPFDFGIGLDSSKKEIKRDTRRSFSLTQKKKIWHQQNGKCAKCHKPLDIRIVEYDHIKPWAAKGRTITENGAALHPNCHKLKTFDERHEKIDKKRKSKKDDNVLGMKNIFGKPPKHSNNNPFGF